MIRPLGVHCVLQHCRERVREHRSGLRERDTVLPQVHPGLPPVPREPRDISVIHFVRRAKDAPKPRDRELHREAVRALRSRGGRAASLRLSRSGAFPYNGTKHLLHLGWTLSCEPMLRRRDLRSYTAAVRDSTVDSDTLFGLLEATVERYVFSARIAGLHGGVEQAWGAASRAGWRRTAGRSRRRARLR